MSTSPATFLIKNGTVLPAADTPPISTFLATHPGAYTTTRTHNNGESLIFYNRHLKRLSNSLQFLLNSNPSFIFGPKFSSSIFAPKPVDFDSMIHRRVTASMRIALLVAGCERSSGEELAVSALIGGNAEELRGRIDDEVVDRVFDVYVHIGMYVPPVFGVAGNGARLAVVGNRRDFAEAKYSDWARSHCHDKFGDVFQERERSYESLLEEYIAVKLFGELEEEMKILKESIHMKEGRLRKPLEKLRPPSATELLLSDNDGRILEGTITNFFVVCSKGNNDYKGEKSHDDGLRSYELQTAPVSSGVLPGIIRQLVLEICLKKGITIREVSPSWLERGNWEEAFITNSLRLVQHVESIQAPSSRALMESESWEEVPWTEKQFKAGPGVVTTLIQREIMKKAGQEGCFLALRN